MNSRNCAFVTGSTSMSNAGHRTCMRIELVVPAERDRVAIRAEDERHLPGCTTDCRPCSMHDRRCPETRPRAIASIGAIALLLMRQPMPHVEERFLVHRLVLERACTALPARPGPGGRAASRAMTASSHARANARTSSRDGHVVDAPLRGTADASESGSMPRSKSVSSRASTGGTPEPAAQERRSR